MAAREDAPFLVRVVGPDGEQDVLARAVIDASGTIETPGALGASGLPRSASARLPTTSSTAFLTCSAQIAAPIRGPAGAGGGQRTLRAECAARSGAARRGPTRTRGFSGRFGGRHSASCWAVRAHDQLEERGKLGSRVRSLLDEGRSS